MWVAGPNELSKKKKNKPNLVARKKQEEKKMSAVEVDSDVLGANLGLLLRVELL